MLRQPTRLDYTTILFLVIIWASAFLAIRVAVVETGPLWLAAIRVVIGFVVLLPWAIWRGFKWPHRWQDWAMIIGISILNVSAPFILISWAELTIDAGLTSLLLGIGPLLALTISHFFTDDDRFTLLKFVAVLLGFLGILLVIGVDALESLGTNMLAQIAVVGSSASYVVSGLMIRKIKGFPPVRLSCLVLGIASMTLIFIALIHEGIPDAALISSVSPKAWACLVYLGLFPTGIGYILRYRLIQAIGMSAFTLGLNLIPVFGIGMGAVLLGEQIHWSIVAALVLIMSGLFLSRLSR
ncbi:MAG: DMT family transporter [Rhizobiales bacterium]|nr:DMT family transporter [Hyphomicrobiales bacterium]